MEGFKFAPEALEYEQEKSKRLLREAKKGAFEMSETESEELLGDMEEYERGLELAIKEEIAGLKKLKDQTARKALEAKIAELKEQLAGLKDFKEASKDAVEFTMKN